MYLDCGPSSTVGAMDTVMTPRAPEPHAHQPWVLMGGWGSRKHLEQVVGVSGVCVYPCSGWAATALPRRAARGVTSHSLRDGSDDLLEPFRSLPES